MLIKFENETEWLAARDPNINSTDVATLFGLNPYKSRLKLWMEKAGRLLPDYEENQFSKWGRRLQIPVAMGICQDENWQGFDLTGYYSVDSLRRQGSSFDIKVVSPDEGDGILEVKVAESFSEDAGWFPDRAPIHYEFQLQFQLHRLRDDDPAIKWGRLGTLGRRQNIRLYRREYDAALGAIIDAEISQFWASIEADSPPKPDYAVDGDILQILRKPIRNGDVINLTGNNRAHELAESYMETTAQRKILVDQLKPIEARRDEIKEELHHIMGRNETAIIGDYQIGAREQVREESVSYGSSFRRFDLKKRRK